MSWPTITVTIRPGAPEEITAALAGEFSDDGIAGIWERPGPGNGALDLVLYFQSVAPEGVFPPLAAARIERLFVRNGLPAPTVSFGTQAREDWTVAWRKGFTAFPCGRRFEVIPSWEQPSGDPDRIVLSIDPGLAFGTGTHETTRLMLESLEDLVDAGPEPAGPGPGVFDIGTGSAILAIAAVKLGFGPVFACDVDPDAVHVAQRNAQKNEVEFGLWLGSAPSVRSGVAGLILANINSAAILELLADIDRMLAPGGILVLSGILDVQEDAIREALGAGGFEIAKRRCQGEWVAMWARRSVGGETG